MADNSNPFNQPPLLTGKTAGEDLISGFAESTMWSIPSLFGFKPPKKVEEFNVEHPYLSFGADMLGTSVPYVGWFKASKAIKGFDKFVTGLGNVERAPFLTGAVQGAARMAPLEIGRVGVNAAFGDTPNTDMIASAAVNSLIMGGVGGVAEFLQAGGKASAKLVQDIPGDDVNLPTPLRLRAIESQIVNGTLQGEDLTKAQRAYSGLKKLSLAEMRNPDRERYVPALIDSGDDPKVLHEFNRLFDTRFDDRGKKLQRRMLVEAPKNGFGSEAAIENVKMRAGLPKDIEPLGQYYRYVSFDLEHGTATANRYNNVISQTLKPVGDNWYMGKEPGEGLYVMARKLNGVAGEGQATDEWVLFKTDAPDAFAKSQAAALKTNYNAGAWAAEDLAVNKDFGMLGNGVADFKKNFTYTTLDAISAGRGEKLYERIQKLFGIKANTPESYEMVKRVHDFVRTHFTPTAYQTKNLRATHIMGTARAAAGAATRLKDSILFGEYKIKPGTNLVWENLKGAKTLESTEGLKHQIEALSDEEITQLWNIDRARIGVGNVADLNIMETNSQITPAVKQAAITMMTHHDDLWESFNKVRRSTGHSETGQTRHQMLVQPEWEGDTRILLRDQGGTVRYMAAGQNKRAAEAAADKAIAKNPTWYKSDEFSMSNAKSLPSELRVYARDPLALMQRKKIGGYKFEDTPWTKKELMEALEVNLTRQSGRQVEMAARYLLEEDMARLAKESPVDYNIAATRMNDFFGKERPLTELQNRVVDSVLGPVLGKNSATKIVAATNTAMWHLSLGAGNVGYVVMNLLNPVQTVIPEISMVLNGVPARLAHYYSTFAAGGTKGPIGTVSKLDPLKIMMSAMKEMRKPDAELIKTFERAGNERLLSPQIAEGFMGSSASTVADMRTALSSPGGFGNWIRSLSEWLPASSERFGRAYAITAGHILGRDFLGLRDKALYQFVKDFNYKTMYGYTAADRPGVFNTPAGTALGLFKNWMVHYMFSMMQYTGEGLNRGNWAPLMWQQAATWGIGGLAASPLLPLANAFDEAWSDKSLIENTYNAFDQRTADGIFYGLPAVMTGLSLSSQASSPMANPARDAEMLFSFATMDRLSFMSKAMGAAMDHWRATGEHPGKSSKMQDMLVRGFAPKTLYKLMAAAQTEGINSLNSGHPISMENSVYDKIAFSLSITPVQLERTYAVSNILWKDKLAHDAEVGRLGSAYAEAMKRGDSDTMSLVLQKATLQGIQSSVLKSANRRFEADNKDLIERNFGADKLIRFKNLLD